MSLKDVSLSSTPVFIIHQHQTHPCPEDPRGNYGDLSARASPVLVLLVEVGHDGQQAGDEGVPGGGGRAPRARDLGRQHGTLPLRLHQLLLHLHILLPEQRQVLLQLLHLLCASEESKVGDRQGQKKRSKVIGDCEGKS